MANQKSMKDFRASPMTKDWEQDDLSSPLSYENILKEEQKETDFIPSEKASIVNEHIDINKITSPKGHRERLKTRFLNVGSDGFSDAEFLELILFRSIPRRDTKPLAKELIARFGSFAEVLAAPKNRLKEVKGVGEGVVLDFKIIFAALERITKEGLRERELLNSWTKVLDYCRTTMGYSQIEQFRILFLDRRNHLIADEKQQQGTIDHTPVYPREVIKRSLELSASALILVHNHPSGDATPSGADISMTQAIIDIAKPLGIHIHDHIIITKDSHTSFKSLKLI